MTAVLDPDVARSASHRHAFDHLIAPYAAGALHHDVPIDATGVARVDWEAREPLVVVATADSLEREGLRVSATLGSGPDATPLPAVEFAPYTERGASLPLHRPELIGTSTASPFSIALAVSRLLPDGTETALPAADVASVVTVAVIEGVLGRLLYIATAEKQRVRRIGREIVAVRHVRDARDDALDRVGSDLAVPRLADTLSFDGTELVTTAARESDAEYRARLRIYRPFLLPNRRTLLARLNGPGAPGDANAGALAAIGFAPRFDVLESDNAFAIAIHLVAAGDDAQRTNFPAFLRATHLVEPGAPVSSDPFVLATRPDESALRARLTAHFTLPPNAHLAPQLAAALDRVGRS